MLNVAARPLSALSICTGGGGLDLGLDLACPGLFAPLAYVEREGTAAIRLAALMVQGAIHSAPIWYDLRTLCESGGSD